MHPLLALALVLIAGIGVTRLSRPPLRRSAPLDELLATGAPFLLFGLLLGPGLGVVDTAGLRVLYPVLALGIGWVGALYGARLEWGMVRRVSRRTWFIGATLALPVLATTAVTAWVLAHALPPLADSWGHPSLAVALALAGAVTTAASQRGPRLGRRNALLDTAFGAAAVVLAIAFSRPHLAVRSLLLTLVSGCGLGGVFIPLARALPDPGEASVPAFALILWGAGFSYAAGLPPFVVCALEAAVMVSLSPPTMRRALTELLSRWARPLYAAFLIIAGALLHSWSVWIIVAALALAVIRVLVRWGTVRLGIDQVDPVWRSLASDAPPPREFASAALRQGASAVALAAGFDLVRGGSAVLVTILLSVMAGEAIATLPPLTASPRRAEVS